LALESVWMVRLNEEVWPVTELCGQVLRTQIFQANEVKLRIRFEAGWASGKHK